MDVCVLLQWCKTAKGRRKVRERSAYHYIFINIYAHEKNIIIPCPDSAGARKGGVRAVFGHHNFEQPPNDLYKMMERLEIT